MRPIRSASIPIVFLIAAILSLAACGGDGGDESPGVVNDGQGPAIACADTIDSAILNQAPGQVVNVTGTVADPDGVTSLQANGTTVSVDTSGAFSTPVVAAWGMNYVNLAAVDGLGNPSSRTCSFLVSETWAPDDAVLSDTISFKARQPVIDDSDRADIDSFADILHTVLNSSGLRDSLYASVVTGQPIGTASGTGYSMAVQITGFQINGPNTVAFSLVSNGLNNTTVVRNIHFALKVSGNVLGVPFSTTGTADLSSVTLNAALRHPANLSQLLFLDNTNITYSGLSSNFDNSLLGVIIDTAAVILNSFVGEFVVSLLQPAIHDLLADEFVSIMNSLYTLDAYQNGQTFDVPRLDGNGTMALDVAANISTLNSIPDRMLIALGTQLQAAPAHARPTLGAPIPAGARALDVTTVSSAASALHVGMINQTLHALWRGGYLDVTLVGGALGGLVPNDVSMQIATDLPPAARLRDDDRLEVALGAMNVTHNDPSLNPTPLDLVVGARVSCATILENEDLMLQDCKVDEFHLSQLGTVLSGQKLADLEQQLTTVLNQIVANAVHDALPALPVTNFALPASLDAYGFGGTKLGMTNPALKRVGDHLVLEGGFSIH
jgi:hypothetical protein